MRRDIGFIFQMHNLFDALSAYENVKMAAQLGNGALGEMRQRCAGILERLGLGHRSDHKPRFLSGGERQRVAIARALVGGPAIVLADEPTGNLDSTTGADIIELLLELNAGGSTIVVITHDTALADRMPRRVDVLDGHIVRDTAAVRP